MSGSKPKRFPLEEASRKFSTAAALVTPEQILTWDELWSVVQARAAGLLARGKTRGQTALLEATPDKETILNLWAAFTASICVHPVHPGLPKRAIEAVCSRLGDPYTILPLEPPDRANRIQPENSRPFSRSYDDTLPATILSTSGSTGEPDLVVHNLAQHLANATGANRNIPLQPGDRWLLTLPLAHVSGLSLLFRTVLSGAALVLPDPGQSLAQQILTGEITHLSLVATQFRRLLADPAKPLQSKYVQAVLLGGSAIPAELIEAAVSRTIPVHISYGSTEMASQICTTAVGADPAKLKTSGRPLSGREVLIDEGGEILVRGDCLAMGIWSNGRIVPLQGEDGWLHSGDLGFLDVQGNLTVNGRLDNRFISGGENIQPEWIESVFLRQAGVEEALVIPIPDVEFGEIAVLLIRGTGISPQRLEPLVKRELPAYMLPKVWYAWPESLPEHTMKISRRKIREYVLARKESLQTIHSRLNYLP